MSTTNPAIQFFIKLFELGNTIRGWSGEGPYVPLDTRPKHDFQIYTSINLVSLIEFIQTMDPSLRDEITNLPVVNYTDGSFLLGTDFIKKLFSDIIDGRASCFIASGQLMTTAIYYLENKYNYNLPAVDITQLKLYC